MDDLILQRTNIQNKLRRAKEPESIETLKAQKAALTEHITPLRRDISIAAEIEEQAAKMKEKLVIIREMASMDRAKEQHKRKGGRIYAR